MAKSTVPKLEPIRHFLEQLDTSMFSSKGEMLSAARKLRADRKAELDDQRATEKHYNDELKAADKAFRDREMSMAEKRALVAQGTHRWCRGFGGCGGKGHLRGKSGVKLWHGPCAGDGLIRNARRGRRPPTRSASRPTSRGRGRQRTKPVTSAPRRRRHRGKKAAATVASGVSLWFYLGDLMGTVGYILAAVVIVLVIVLKVLALVLRGGAALAGASR